MKDFIKIKFNTCFTSERIKLERMNDNKYYGLRSTLYIRTDSILKKLPPQFTKERFLTTVSQTIPDTYDTYCNKIGKKATDQWISETYLERIRTDLFKEVEIAPIHIGRNHYLTFKKTLWTKVQ